ncbi:TPA: acyl carrier protein [Candidatus Dependentiae bacterium]|nr:MAG: Acyl carrier protein [candidate division TM6 bacterium GW2011_GWF2_43_87]HBL98653.1 acyl carrier protein [Candidatus Dependentiae bacterium]
MTHAQDTAEKLRKIVAGQLSIVVDTIKDESTFDELGADSLDRVEIIMKIEEAFDVELDDDKAEKILNFGELRQYVETLRQ